MNSYVEAAAKQLLPIVQQIVSQKGTITVADVWAHDKAANDVLYATDRGMLGAERGPAIVAAFKLAGLKPTGQRVANTNATARYRKVMVWAQA